MIPSPTAAALGQRSNSYDESFLHRRRGNDSDLIVLKATEPEPLRSMEAPPVVMHNVYRTNFGKSQVYQPPMTNGWKGYQTVHDYHNNNNNNAAAAAETSSTTSIPFDQEASEIGRRLLHDTKESYSGNGNSHGRITGSSRGSRHKPAALNDPYHSRPLSSSLQLKRVGSDKSRPFDEAPMMIDKAYDNGTDWEHSPKQQRHSRRPGGGGGRNYHSDQDLYFGRFQMPPPRVSGPVVGAIPPFCHDNDNGYMEASSGGSGNYAEKSDESMEAVFGNNSNKNEKVDSFLSENQSGEESSVPLNYIPFALQQDKSSPSLKKERRQSTSSSGDDDDSLFDFVEDGGVMSKVKSNSRRRSDHAGRNSNSTTSAKAKAKAKTHYETDDTSLDQPYGSVTAATSLQERTQAAWKRKSSQRGDPSLSSTSSPQHQVSFGKKDTVQYYNPENDEMLESSTLGGRSLNSMYTKSAESEVEDIIKDIFLIGSGKANNPGRRKIKHSPAVKNKLRHRQDITYNDDDGTMETFGEEEPLDTTIEEDISRDSSSLHKPSPRKKSTTTATPITHKADRSKSTTSRTATATTTSAVNTVSDTSYTGETATRSETVSRSSKSRGVSTKISSSVTINDDMTAETSKADDPLASVWGFLFGSEENRSKKKKEKRSRAAVDDDDDDGDDENCAEAGCVKPDRGGGGGGIEDLLNFASDVILGPEGPETRDIESEKKSSKKASKEEKPKGVDVIRVDSRVPGVKRAVSLEEDLRLVDLAMQAARSKHKIQGCELDESYNVNIVEDISFTVLDLEMPLGLIFQENETGCWVTKVLPNGSASRKGNKVQIGDQLAAIDGISAIHMTVGEIADAITSKKGEVELTFLRYVGALHPLPGSVVEEGWEVRNTPPRQPAVQTSRRSPMAGFLRGSPGKNKSKPAEVEKSAEKRRFRLFRRKKDAKV